MKILPIKLNFYGDKYNLQGLQEYSKLSRVEQNMLINHEQIRQSFNEKHPELAFEKKLTPLEKYVEEQVAHSRKIERELKILLKKGKKI